MRENEGERREERVFLQVNKNRQAEGGGGYEKSTEADFFLAVK